MTFRTIRRPVLLATVAVLAVGLAACGGSSSGGDAGASGGGKTITYWATNMAPSLADDEKTLKPELEKFTKATGVTVKLEVIPWDSLYNRILTAVSSGQGPDVLNIGNTWSASLQATGAFVPFDDAAYGKVGGKDAFVPTSLTATGAEGKVPTSVPLYGQAYGLFYNTKLFAAAGITTPPATWADFVAAAKKLTKDTNDDGKPDQWGLGVIGADVPTNSHFAFVLGRQHGSELFTGDGKPQFANPGQIAAVKRFVDLMATDKVVSPSNAEYTSTQAMADFVKGKVAMVLTQSGSRGYLAANNFTDYAVAQPPVVDPLPAGGKPVQTMVAGINVSVFGNSKNKDAALDLVKFLTSKDEQTILSKAYGTLPVVTSAYSDPAFADPASQTFGKILTEHAETMPMIAQEGQMETLLGGVLKNLFAKAATGTVSEADVTAQLTTANQQMAAAG